MEKEIMQDSDIAEQEKQENGGADAEQENAGRLFTQEEVNEIVKNRLARNKEENQQNADRIEEIAKREKMIDARMQRLECMEYVIESKYPKELLDVIDTTDAEEFREKADKIVAALKPAMPYRKMTEPREVQRQTIIDKEFLAGNHEPKKYW